MTQNDKPVVRFDVTDGIGVITIDYPPVNALGPGVGDGIIASLEKGEADPSVSAATMRQARLRHGIGVTPPVPPMGSLCTAKSIRDTRPALAPGGAER